MKFRDAATIPVLGVTNNGMPTFTASGNSLVDLFSAIGSSRGKDIRPLFDAAYALDRVKALKLLLWARDVRGGAGERQTVRTLIQHLETINPDDAAQLIPYLPVFGRWDDLLIFQTDGLRDAAFSVIAQGLTDPATAGLTAKWMPRKGKMALALERFLEMTPTVPGFHQTAGKAYPGKTYRHMLVELTNAVEQRMCAREWDQIVFDHVPSLAAARYQKAFNRRCAERYQAYKAGLVKGTTKINAASVYPYDVIRSIINGDAQVAKAQWKALPNLLGDEQLLAMVDVSGSMTSRVAGSTTLRHLDVATSLGLYVADKACGPFKDCFLTFSGSPKLEVLTGDILSKHAQMCRSHWTQNTNLMGAFMEILKVANRHQVADTDMPRMLLILSDMEFDYCVSNANEMAMDMVRRMYRDAGYTLPKVVFWNLNARAGNSPVQYRDGGTALVSGFSPAVMKSILQARDFSPLGVMEQTIGNPRYDVIDRVKDPVGRYMNEHWGVLGYDYKLHY
jgi:hypothetical protein